MKKRMMDMKGNEGFTLIELIVVVVILGILAGIVIGKFGGNTKDAEIAACYASRKALAREISVLESKGEDISSATLWKELTDHYKCPKGGTYTWHVDTFKVSCSEAEHVDLQDSGTLLTGNAAAERLGAIAKSLWAEGVLDGLVNKQIDSGSQLTAGKVGATQKILEALGADSIGTTWSIAVGANGAMTVYIANVCMDNPNNITDTTHIRSGWGLSVTRYIYDVSGSLVSTTSGYAVGQIRNGTRAIYAGSFNEDKNAVRKENGDSVTGWCQ